MQRLEDSGAVRPIYGSLGVKRLMVLHVMTSYSLVGHAFHSNRLYNLNLESAVHSYTETHAKINEFCEKKNTEA